MLPSLPCELWYDIITYDTRQTQLDGVCQEWKKIMQKKRQHIPHGTFVVPSFLSYINILGNFETEYVRMNIPNKIELPWFVSSSVITAFLLSLSDDSLMYFILPWNHGAHITLNRLKKKMTIDIVYKTNSYHLYADFKVEGDI
jgi:hypothetical protein